MTIKIKYNKEDCIGCGACAVECPDNWEVVETPDGYKAEPKEKELEEAGNNQAAADVCPVECIKIVED
jgi:ferredoxin